LVTTVLLTILGFSSVQIIIFLETWKFSCHFFTLFKSYVKAKEEELWKNSNISPCKNIIFEKTNPLKETKFLQDIII
jgi:hypothetical protein